jgi:hemoglobin
MVMGMRQDVNPLAPGASCGIDESTIRTLVHAFYARVRNDVVLGPIFNGAIDDWDAHLDKLCAFWSSVTLMSGRYKGTPMQAHAALPDIDSHHFARWLALFAETARSHCSPAAAALFIDRAERIAQSLQMGIALHRGALTSGRDGHI